MANLFDGRAEQALAEMLEKKACRDLNAKAMLSSYGQAINKISLKQKFFNYKRHNAMEQRDAS